MSSIAIQVFMVKLLLSGLIFLLSISTLWYALVVYYEPDSLIKRPLQCISETLLLPEHDHANVNDDEINNISIIDDFWLDKLALLGAKRAGSVLFWDDAVDLSLLLSSSSSSSSTKTIDENKITKNKKKRQLLERVAENCGLEFLVQKQDDEHDNEIWTLISNRTILDHPLLISSSSSSLSSSSWSWWSWMVPRYSQLPGTFTFKAHIRFCRRGSSTSSIRCPAFVVSDNDKDGNEDVLSINDVLPTDKDCLVSGASTRCPRHVDKILLQEFGEKWKSDLLLNFRKQHRRV